MTKTVPDRLLFALDYVSCEYRWVEAKKSDPGWRYRLTLRSTGYNYDVDSKSEIALQFAAELEAAAAVVRAHVASSERQTHNAPGILCRPGAGGNSISG